MKNPESNDFEFAEGGSVWNTGSFGKMGSLVRMPVTGEDLLWKQIREKAKSNPALQQMLDQILTLYKLIKD